MAFNSGFKGLTPVPLNTHKPEVRENRAQKKERMFGSKRKQETVESCGMRSSMLCSVQQTDVHISGFMWIFLRENNIRTTQLQMGG